MRVLEASVGPIDTPNFVELDNPDRLAEIKTELVSDRLWRNDGQLMYDVYSGLVSLVLDRYTGKGLLVDPKTLELFDPTTREVLKKSYKGDDYLPKNILALVKDDRESPFYSVPIY